MVDGVSGIQLLALLLDPSPDAPPPAPLAPEPTDATSGTGGHVVEALLDRARARSAQAQALLGLLARPRATVGALRESAGALAHVGGALLAGRPSTPFNGRIGTARELSWVPLSLDAARSIKRALGGSINDVVLAVAAGALRRLLLQRRIDPDGLELRAIVPVSLRSSQQYLSLGNRISIMMAPLPVGVRDPVERLRRVQAEMARLKTSNEAAKMDRLFRMVELLPPSLHHLLGWIPEPGRPINTVCTNVPGPPVALYQQGVRVTGMVPFVPLVDGIGVAFAVLSYEDTLTVGVTADPGLVPDVDAVSAAVQAAFGELWLASGAARPAPRGGRRAASRHCAWTAQPQGGVSPDHRDWAQHAGHA
jgi:WS/DGAT/MGAT family acyltransferase